MRELNLTIFAEINSSLISAPVIIAAIVVLAIILFIGGLFILRSGKNKPTKSPLSMSGTSDWQRQGQPGGAAGWNPQQQGPATGWNQQGVQQQQQGWNAPNGASQNSWGGVGAPQQPAANPWGNGTPSQPSWGGAGAPQQPAANPWGNGTPSQPEQPQWGNNPAQPAANPWGTSSPQQQPQQPQWGQPQAAPADPWGAPPTAAPAAQDPWSQQAQPQAQPISGQQWGAAPQPQPSQAPTGWGQPQQGAPADPWGSTPQPQSGGFPNPAAAQQPWQPNQAPAGYGQQDPNAMFAGAPDNDRTMLRSSGQPQAGGAIGYVRVEEGKEPGRIYEIKKESLSMGRSRESDIFLEDLAVSRLHASLVNMGNGSYALKDEGSANGTKVNGQLVNKFQTYPLQEGDRIQLGQTVLVFAKK